jgi:hypothetical protein
LGNASDPLTTDREPMSPGEYQELVGFLAEQFKRIDARFDGVDARLTRVEVTGERTQHDLGLVIERVDLLDAKVERYHFETKEEFASVRSEMRGATDFWGKRVEALEERVERGK